MTRSLPLCPRSAMSADAKRARSSAESATHLPDLCVAHIMSHMELLDIVPLASVSVAWRAVAAGALQAWRVKFATMQALWRKPDASIFFARLAERFDRMHFGRDEWRVESRGAVPFMHVAHAVAFPHRSLAPAPASGVDLSVRIRAGRTFQYHISSGCSMDVLGGAPVDSLVISGPRSATVIAKGSQTKIKAKGKGAAVHSSGSAAGGGGSTAATGEATSTAERVRTAKVQVKGTSVFRGITIEGDIVIAAGGHLTMLRCCLRGTVTLRHSAKLMMIECNIDPNPNNPANGRITLGKGSLALILGCAFTGGHTSIKAARGFLCLRVSGCKFEQMANAIVFTERADGIVQLFKCSFYDVSQAIEVIRAHPRFNIEEIRIIRTRPNKPVKAMFLNSLPGSPVRITPVRITNMQFIDRAPADGRVAIEEFFCALHGAVIIVDNEPPGYGALDGEVCKVQVDNGSRVFFS